MGISKKGDESKVYQAEIRKLVKTSEATEQILRDRLYNYMNIIMKLHRKNI